jgi:hypothetical protein
MKDFGQIGLILLMVATWTFSSCNDTTRSGGKKLTQADSVWINFRTQLESENIDFLIKNSLDTIQCADCDIKTERQTEFYDADIVFKEHIDKVKYLKSFKDKEFSTYAVDNLIRVNYSFPATNSQDKGYNLIFTFIKVDERYLFMGMIVT